MRLALVSLLALAFGANAYAQAPAAPATPAATPPTPPAPPASAAAPPPAAPATPAPSSAPAATTAPSASPAPATAASGAPAPTADATPAAPPAPPPPPAPPTDPTAIAVLNILQQVCIPSAQGGNFAQLVKSAGLRKSGDLGWSLRQKDFTLTVQNPGSNPTQCHVVVTHPADLESPGRPIIIALNDWAGVEHGWSLYRNDKTVLDGVQYTTRSWQLDWNGAEQSLVFTTKRKQDGTPLHSNADESELVYGVEKTG
jgi:hypothetical protein